MPFGDVLKELREKAGLSQVELAEKAGTSQRAISFWEQNKREPALSNIQKLCDALGVTCDVFFEAKKPKKK
jgi:transcriptional regulator with XRE-family HTH domain